ncbi:hypothetical protein [Krasilnikovia cinnamomea]|nr:hypothetical protein [Krasilnikovia cinnamomea]
MSDETVGAAVTLRVYDWLSLVDDIDNEISSAVEDEDTEDHVEVAERVREIVLARAYLDEETPLPNDQQVSVQLTDPDWNFVMNTLSHWADIADDMTPGVDPDGTEGREVVAAIRAQLGRNSSGE